MLSESRRTDQGTAVRARAADSGLVAPSRKLEIASWALEEKTLC